MTPEEQQKLHQAVNRLWGDYDLYLLPFLLTLRQLNMTLYLPLELRKSTMELYYQLTKE